MRQHIIPHTSAASLLAASQRVLSAAIEADARRARAVTYAELRGLRHA